MNETKTKIDAVSDMEDPFFVTIHVSRVIDGETPYEYMHNIKLDLHDSGRLKTVISMAINRSKERFREHLEAEYEEMKVTEARAMERALNERRERGVSTADVVDAWSIPVSTTEVGAPIVFLKEEDEDDERSTEG